MLWLNRLLISFSRLAQWLSDDRTYVHSYFTSGVFIAYNSDILVFRSSGGLLVIRVVR
jgi:hypothetical protein